MSVLNEWNADVFLRVHVHYNDKIDLHMYVYMYIYIFDYIPIGFFRLAVIAKCC